MLCLAKQINYSYKNILCLQYQSNGAVLGQSLVLWRRVSVWFRKIYVCSHSVKWYVAEARDKLNIYIMMNTPALMYRCGCLTDPSVVTNHIFLFGGGNREWKWCPGPSFSQCRLQTSICVENKYLFEAGVLNHTFYLSLFDNHLVPNTLYLSLCLFFTLDTARWILLHVL